MFYAVAGPLMKINGWIYSNFRFAGAIKATPVRLHLGPGTKAYLPGWTNIDMAIAKFIENDHDWFNDWPDKYDSIGGRFADFIFCRNEHLTILTQSLLVELATRSGFDEVKKHLPITGIDHAELFVDCMAKEHERTPEAPHTLLLEMQKSA